MEREGDERNFFFGGGDKSGTETERATDPEAERGEEIESESNKTNDQIYTHNANQVLLGKTLTLM